jgi:DNA polymerase III delta subunit
MRKITQLEQIAITNDAEEFILNVCNNTAKILINYLEKFKLLNEPITLELATNVCSNISLSTFEDYTQLLKDEKIDDAIHLLYGIYDKGYSVMDILDNYFVFIKITKMLSEQQKYNIIPFICKYITVFHNIHEDEIELALFSNNLQQVVKESV